MSSKVGGGRLKQHLQEKNSVDIDNTEGVEMKLSELFNPNEFAARHLSFGDEAALLEALGEKSMDDFVGNTVPQSIRMPSELDLPEALTEADALAKLKGIASKNVINKSYIGLGYYPTRVPNVILRKIASATSLFLCR